MGTEDEARPENHAQAAKGQVTEMAETRAVDPQVVLDQLGNPADVDRELQRFRRAARIFSSQRPRLIDRYAKQWVAVHDGKVRARARTFAAALAQVDKLGLPRENVIVRFIDRNQRTMIL